MPKFQIIKDGIDRKHHIEKAFARIKTFGSIGKLIATGSRLLILVVMTE